MNICVPPPRVRAFYESRLRSPLRANADGWAGAKSPFRQDHNASLSINLTHGGWRDHGTDESGDIFTFEMKLTGCDFATAKARILGEPTCDLPAAKAAPQNGQAGTRATVEALAQAKKLPLEFLRSFGLKNQSQGVFIPYRLADNSPACPRRCKRAALLPV
jgi:DNA primase